MLALAGETDVTVVGRAESSSRAGRRDQLGNGDCFVTMQAWVLRAKTSHNSSDMRIIEHRQTMRVKPATTVPRRGSTLRGTSRDC
jgi:hypothetical protein